MEMPSHEQITAAFAEARREQAFWQENYRRFAKQYPDRFLAVRDGEVIAVADDPFELADAIRALGFEPSQVWTSFVPAEPMRLLL